MEDVATIVLDMAKSVFPVLGVSSDGEVSLGRGTLLREPARPTWWRSRRALSQSSGRGCGRKAGVARTSLIFGWRSGRETVPTMSAPGAAILRSPCG